jgi:SAM-dependent methyltransferase
VKTGRQPDFACPICGSETTFQFLRRSSVPVHQNLLFRDASAARGASRGDMTMCLCQRCNFGFNGAFRPELLDYSQNYDNTQTWSPAFDRYVDGLVRELVEVHGVRGCRVVELGCGKGAFLKKLVAYPGAGNVGHGFDPAYVGPEVDLEGRLLFSRSFFEGASDLEADVIVCRHVIEHLREPLALLRSLRTALVQSGRALVFFETPCLEWILHRQVVWDFFYEHCSLFTACSLATAFEVAGFGEISVRQVFNGQYLWLRGQVIPSYPLTPVRSYGPTESSPSNTLRLARLFAQQEQGQMRSLEALVGNLVDLGTVVVWGAGAKGVTFCNLVDPLCQFISGVIDLNPAKQGKYVAGTGHRIYGPDYLRSAGISAVLVLNPYYADEIAAHVRHLGSQTVVINAMRAETRNLCA